MREKSTQTMKMNVMMIMKINMTTMKINMMTIHKYKTSNPKINISQSTALTQYKK